MNESLFPSCFGSGSLLLLEKKTMFESLGARHQAWVPLGRQRPGFPQIRGSQGWTLHPLSPRGSLPWILIKVAVGSIEVAGVVQRRQKLTCDM